MQKAMLALLGVAAFWGTGPLFYSAINYVPAFEILCHRVIWGAVTYAFFLWIRNGFGQVPAILKNPQSRKLILWAAFFISINWGIFIYAVGHGHATESSIAYYIYPLLNFVVGYVVFSERLLPVQMLAAAMAVLAVLLLTYGLGRVPLFALAIAVSFAGYNAVKRAMNDVPTLPSVFAETVVLLPIALIYLIGWGSAFDFSAPNALFTNTMLMLSGPYTAIPLILFGIAAQQFSLSTVGMLSYVNPSLQLLCAATVLGEALTLWHWVALCLIWMAIFAYISASLKGRR